jgi:hypothetical protein
MMRWLETYEVMIKVPKLWMKILDATCVWPLFWEFKVIESFVYSLFILGTLWSLVIHFGGGLFCRTLKHVGEYLRQKYEVKIHPVSSVDSPIVYGQTCLVLSV